MIFFSTYALNFSLYLIYTLLGVAIAIMILFIFWRMATNIKKSAGILIGIGVLLLLVFIGYLTSSSELSLVAVKLQETSNSVKWVGAGLFTFYFVFFGTIATIVITAIYNAIKKR